MAIAGTKGWKNKQTHVPEDLYLTFCNVLPPCKLLNATLKWLWALWFLHDSDAKLTQGLTRLPWQLRLFPITSIVIIPLLCFQSFWTWALCAASYSFPIYSTVSWQVLWPSSPCWRQPRQDHVTATWTTDKWHQYLSQGKKQFVAGVGDKCHSLPYGYMTYSCRFVISHPGNHEDRSGWLSDTLDVFLDWLDEFWGPINTPTACHPSVMSPSLHPSRPEVYMFPTNRAASPGESSPF